MSTILFAVQGNTQPTLSITLERDGAAIDLSGASVVLVISNENTGVVTNSGHQSCTVNDATHGVITYTPQSGDFASAGRYQGEAQVTYPANAGKENVYELVTIVVRDKTQ